MADEPVTLPGLPARFERQMVPCEVPHRCSANSLPPEDGSLVENTQELRSEDPHCALRDSDGNEHTFVRSSALWS